VPPRAMTVPFPLGRPLGVPNDAEFQHRLLSAALKLLQESGSPVFENYEEDAPDVGETEDTWVCPVSFAVASEEVSLETAVLDEMALLQPWYDKGRESKATTVGVSSLELAEAVRFVASFLAEEPPEHSPVAGVRVADLLKYAVEDIKAFYNEAAANQPGSASVKEMEDWYWGESSAGKLVREVKQTLLDHDNRVIKITASLLLVPGSQAYRDIAKSA
jgi:hypothetical protein